MQNNTMYNLVLDDDRIKRYVTGLDSSIRLICQHIAQAQSPGFELKKLLPDLIKINQEFDFLQETVDAAEKLKSKPIINEEIKQ